MGGEEATEEEETTRRFQSRRAPNWDAGMALLTPEATETGNLKWTHRPSLHRIFVVHMFGATSSLKLVAPARAPRRGREPRRTSQFQGRRDSEDTHYEESLLLGLCSGRCSRPEFPVPCPVPPQTPPRSICNRKKWTDTITYTMTFL